MSNLGTYQLLTVAAKKVHGPGKLVAGIFTGGALLGWGLHSMYKKTKERIKEKYKEVNRSSSEETYTILVDGESSDGLHLKKGDTFKVLENDGDSILIEVLGDQNNPHFISRDLLEAVSNYTKE